VVSYIRKGKKQQEEILVILNMTPQERLSWVVYVDEKSTWKEIFNSDQTSYWGTGNYINAVPLVAVHDAKHHTNTIQVSLPPLGATVFKRVN
jgi:1,4-alpha-glucan branching enzyme